MIIADSDVLIGFLNKDGDSTSFLKKAIATGKPVRTSSISVQEIMFGILPKEEIDTVEFLQGLGILEFGTEEALQTGILRKELKAKGTPIGLADELIAGICLANNASILTKNKKHFSKVEGLKIIDW